ncbi:MAG: PilZ domain-containing protein [Nitrospirota bacterium]|nr:PilZ domain-containing protein [Nitrospirota bacterium]
MDRRLAPRFKVHLPISFSRDSLTGEGIVVNLSLGGCAVESEQKVQRWKYVTLHIFLPNQDAPLVVDRAQVRSSHRRQLLPLEFLDMQPEEQARLHRFVSALDAGPSR